MKKLFLFYLLMAGLGYSNNLKYCHQRTQSFHEGVSNSTGGTLLMTRQHLP